MLLWNLHLHWLTFLYSFQASSDIENDDDKLNPNAANEETDVSLSLAAEEEEENDVNIKNAVDVVDDTVKVKHDTLCVRHVEEDNSSHVDTDSLEENSGEKNEGKKDEWRDESEQIPPKMELKLIEATKMRRRQN